MSQTTPTPIEYATPSPRWRPQLRSFRLLWPMLALALLLAYNGKFTDRFFNVETVSGRLSGVPVDVLHGASATVLLALGMTLVIATGGVDLSVGATMAIAATVAAVYVRGPLDSGGIPEHPPGNVAIAMLLAIGVALLCGAWNGLLVAVFDIQPIIATLILMIAGRGVAELISDGQNVAMPEGSFRWLHYLPPGGGAIRERLLYPIPLDVLWAAVAIVAVLWLTRRTALGLFLESVGNNAVASRYAGVRSGWVKFIAYAACGVTAGAAGLLETANIGSASLGLGVTRELDAILAVSLGGTALAGGRFSLLGSVVGAVLISTLEKTVLLTHVYGRQIPNEWFQVAKAVVIIAVCLVQSDVLRTKVAGLFKRR